MDAVINFIGENIVMIYILVLGTFLGTEVISKVPTVLHTPLMSGSNAISGVVIIGGIFLLRKTSPTDYVSLSIGFFAIALATINVVGGFAVTQRMLEMFKKRKKN